MQFFLFSSWRFTEGVLARYLLTCSANTLVSFFQRNGGIKWLSGMKKFRESANKSEDLLHFVYIFICFSSPTSYCIRFLAFSLFHWIDTISNIEISTIIRYLFAESIGTFPISLTLCEYFFFSKRINGIFSTAQQRKWNCNWYTRSQMKLSEMDGLKWRVHTQNTIFSHSIFLHAFSKLEFNFASVAANYFFHFSLFTKLNQQIAVKFQINSNIRTNICRSFFLFVHWHLNAYETCILQNWRLYILVRGDIWILATKHTIKYDQKVCSIICNIEEESDRKFVCVHDTY